MRPSIALTKAGPDGGGARSTALASHHFWGQERKPLGFHTGGGHLHTVGGPREVRVTDFSFLGCTWFADF